MPARKTIVVVGLGPGRWEDLTVEASDTLLAAPLVICRTLRHPTVDTLREQAPALTLESFDHLYESAASFAELYPTMVRELLARAHQEPVIYAVPGHPLLGEESVRLLRAEASAARVKVRIVAGLSYIEPVCAALDVDPLERDLQLVDATRLGDVPSAALMGVILPTKPALIAQMYNRRLAGATKLALSELYPPDWEVALVRWAGLPRQRVIRLPLHELDRNPHADHLTTLYVPPLPPLHALRVPEGLRYVVARLRAPDGCPGDRKQTHQSLRTYVLEEAYEVAEVLDAWDGSPEMAEKLADELGDLLLQVYLQAEIGDQEDLFSIADVFEAVTAKLIRRHPHVFGEVEVADAEEVLRNWDAIKRGERAARGEDVADESTLHGVPRGIPALTQAHELSAKAAKVGFEWPTTDGFLAKVAEETRELAAEVAAGQTALATAELGDLLFALATLARRLHISAEDALRGANGRFRARFEAMEAQARAQGRTLDMLSPDEWETLWIQAKGS